MNDISISRICRNTYNSFSETYKDAGPVLKTYIPCLISAVFFRGLSQQALLLPPDTVVYYASKVCEAASWAITAKAGLAFFMNREKENEQPKIDNNIIKNPINELEITRLKEEINYWHDQLKCKNRMLNLEPEHQVLLNQINL